MIVAFDFDGVISDSLESILELIKKSQKEVASGRAPTKKDFHELKIHTADAMAAHLGIDNDLIKKFSNKFFELQSKKTNITPMFADIDYVIRELSSKFSIVVVSASNSKAIIKFLRHHKLENYFSEIHGADKPGTKGQKLTKIKNKHNSNLVMIGDTRGDIIAGKEAKAYTIAASWGHQKIEDLKLENPDFIANTPEDILKAKVFLNLN